MKKVSRVGASALIGDPPASRSLVGPPDPAVPAPRRGTNRYCGDRYGPGTWIAEGANSPLGHLGDTTSQRPDREGMAVGRDAFLLPFRKPRPLNRLVIANHALILEQNAVNLTGFQGLLEFAKLEHKRFLFHGIRLRQHIGGLGPAEV